jgi:subtilisin-like proprotein convertase family protein
MKKANFTKLAVRLLTFAIALFIGQFAGAQTFNGQGGIPVPPVGTSGTTVSTANVTASGNIGTDFLIDNVTLDITHTWSGDLFITLESPGGTVLTLTENNGGSGDNYSVTVFKDDDGTDYPNITAGSPPFNGTFNPEGGELNTVFSGSQVNGNWTLTVVDEVGGDSGFLTAWSITLSPLQLSCEIECPDDISVSNDPGECGAFVTIPDPILNGDCVEVSNDLQLSTGDVPYGVQGAATGTMSGAISVSNDIDLNIEFNGDHDLASINENFRLAGPDGVILVNTIAPQCGTTTVTVTVPQATWNNWVATFGSDLQFSSLAGSGINLICQDYFNVSATISLPGTSTFTNNITGPGNASAFYPVGTTVVQYCAQDASGLQTCCEFTVTVTDDEAPTFDPCPSDIVLTLDPGACGAFINYTVAAFDNCPAVASTVAGPLCDPCVDPSGGSALACAPFAQNSIIQFVELPGNGTIDFFCFNQETFGNAPLATINIYGPQATPPSTQGGDTPIGSQMYQTNAADDGSCVCVDFDTPVVIPAGANGVWVEVFTPGVTLNSRVVQTPASCDGNNATGQDTWIEAPACGLTPPGTFASLGFVLDASFALGYNPGEW